MDNKGFKVALAVIVVELVIAIAAAIFIPQGLVSLPLG